MVRRTYGGFVNRMANASPQVEIKLTVSCHIFTVEVKLVS